MVPLSLHYALSLIQCGCNTKSSSEIHLILIKLINYSHNSATINIPETFIKYQFWKFYMNHFIFQRYNTYLKVLATQYSCVNAFVSDKPIFRFSSISLSQLMPTNVQLLLLSENVNSLKKSFSNFFSIILSYTTFTIDDFKLYFQCSEVLTNLFNSHLGRITIFYIQQDDDAENTHRWWMYHCTACLQFKRLDSTVSPHYIFSVLLQFNL